MWDSFSSGILAGLEFKVMEHCVEEEDRAQPKTPQRKKVAKRGRLVMTSHIYTLSRV